MQNQGATVYACSSGATRPVQCPSAFKRIDHLVYGTHRMNRNKPARMRARNGPGIDRGGLALPHARSNNTIENGNLPFARRLVIWREIEPYFADERTERSGSFEFLHQDVIV